MSWPSDLHITDDGLIHVMSSTGFHTRALDDGRDLGTIELAGTYRIAFMPDGSRAFSLGERGSEIFPVDLPRAH